MLEHDALYHMKQMYLMVHRAIAQVGISMQGGHASARVKEILIRQRVPEEEAVLAISLYNAVGFSLHMKIVSENPSEEWLPLFTEDLWTVLHNVHPTFGQLRVLYT